MDRIDLLLESQAGLNESIKKLIESNERLRIRGADAAAFGGRGEPGTQQVEGFSDFVRQTGTITGAMNRLALTIERANERGGIGQGGFLMNLAQAAGGGGFIGAGSRALAAKSRQLKGIRASQLREKAQRLTKRPAEFAKKSSEVWKLADTKAKKFDKLSDKAMREGDTFTRRAARARTPKQVREYQRKASKKYAEAGRMAGEAKKVRAKGSAESARYSRYAKIAKEKIMTPGEKRAQAHKDKSEEFYEYARRAKARGDTKTYSEMREKAEEHEIKYYEELGKPKGKSKVEMLEDASSRAEATASLMRFAGTVGLAVSAVYHFGKAITDATDQQIAAMRHYAQHSASLSIVMAQRDIRQMRRDMEIGEALAPSTRGLTESEQNRKDNTKYIEILINRVQNGILGGLNDLLSGLLTPLNEIAKLLNPTVANPERLGDFLQRNKEEQDRIIGKRRQDMDRIAREVRANRNKPWAG